MNSHTIQTLVKMNKRIQQYVFKRIFMYILMCTVQVALSSASFHPDGLILGTGTETGNMQVS